MWGLLTSVNVAVVQIIVLGIFAVIGMTIRQLPEFAFRTPTDYAEQMDLMHQRYDGLFGSAVVSAFERIGVFQVFSSWWFSASLILLLVSIVACTLDRTPRLWRQSHDIRVVQPDAYFDPRLPDRAAIDGLAPEDVRAAFRKRRLGVRVESAVSPDGQVVTYVYGDRHRYTKLATLLTHLGLILFLVAAAVTSRFGYETPLVVASGDTTTVQPIGTPNLLVVKNLGFAAPRLPDGQFADFTTDLAVYRNGTEIARKTIRVNDPLSVAGFTFHQNGFGPAPDLVIRDSSGGLLWSGPVAMTDSAAGRPYISMAVPGRDLGFELYLDQSNAAGSLLIVLPYRITGTNPDGTPVVQSFTPFGIGPGGEGQAPGLDLSVAMPSVGAYTLLIAKQDPGQGLVWAAFGSLILGLLITFYLPRRRAWAKIEPTGRMAIHFRADRYVDAEREFGQLLDDLVARRRPPGAPEPGPASPAPPARPAGAPAS